MRKSLAALCLVMGVLTVLCFPVSWHRPTADIVITALGTANPAAKSAEVWIEVFGRDDARTLMQEGEYGKGWEARDTRMVSYTGQPASVRWHGRIDEPFTIVLTRHPYSGRARVAWNGAVREFDLYQADQGAVVLSPADFADARTYVPLPRLALEHFAKGICVGAVYFLVLQALSFFLRRGTVQRTEPPPLRWTAVFALPSLVVYFVAHLGFWPAQMSLDSINLWQQLKTDPVNDATSAFHTGIAMLAAQVYDSPASMIVVNWLLLTAATVLWLRELWRWGVPRSVLLLAAILFPLFPANFFMVTVLWKDVIYAVGFLFTFTAILQVLRVGGDQLPRRTALLLGVGLVVIALARHNGVLVAPGIAVLILLITHGTRNFKLAGASCAVALVSIASVKLVLYPALSIMGLPERFKAIVPIHVIAAYVTKEPSVLAGKEPLLSEIMPMHEWKARYDCQTVGPLFFNDVVDYPALGRRARDLIGVMARSIAADPLIYLEHQLCATSILWKLDNQGDFLYTVPAQVEDSRIGRSLGLSMTPKLPGVFQGLVELKELTEEQTARPFFWGTAPALWLSVFIAAYLAVRSGDKRKLLLCALPVLNAASLAALIGSPDYRYVYPSVVIMLALLPLLTVAPAQRAS